MIDSGLQCASCSGKDAVLVRSRQKVMTAPVGAYGVNHPENTLIFFVEKVSSHSRTISSNEVDIF